MRHTRGFRSPGLNDSNYMKIVKMVGPPGLEPVDVGSDGLLEQLDRAVLNQGCHSD